MSLDLTKIKDAWLLQETLQSRQLTTWRIKCLHERGPLLGIKPEVLTVGQQFIGLSKCACQDKIADRTLGHRSRSAQSSLGL